MDALETTIPEGPGWVSSAIGPLLRRLGYDLPREAVVFLDDDLHLLDFFMRVCLDDKTLGREAAKWLMGTASELMAETRTRGRDLPLRALHYREFCEMSRAREFTPTDGKAVLREMWARRVGPRATDAFASCSYAGADELRRMVAEAIEANPGPAGEARDGSSKALNWLVGRVMRAAAGKADAVAAKDALSAALAAA